MSPRTMDYYLNRLAGLERPQGFIGVNLGGAGEEPGYVNINNGIDRRNPDAIPNLIHDRAENVALHFRPDTVHHVTANNIVPGTFDWPAVATGVHKVLRHGGLVSLAEFGGGYAKGENIRAALQAAGFGDVVIISSTLVVSEK